MNILLDRNLLAGIGLTLVFTVIGAGPGLAASYESLVKKGYKTGKLTRSKAGSLGWYVSNGTELYFCKFRGGTVYVGNSGMAVFTSSGRQISSDRKAYNEYQGRPADYRDPSIPQLEDLKAGKPRPLDVQSCIGGQ